MPNRLANENSPYLLQHANNPVDWYPWGSAALEKAKAEDKPIFLSIGYAACHWCHVMEHESFEDETTAALMNEHFVNIKVDREERPDLDNIYMQAVVAMTRQGGWPMSVFLTPEGEPFYGGTYFPPVQRYNMPAFREVLQAVARLWQEDRPRLLQSAQQITQHLQETIQLNPDTAPLDKGIPEQAALNLAQNYDWKYGGWGQAPKFPQPMALEFLLQRASRGDQKVLDVAEHALQAMARGGMYDVIGGGFARYSVDDEWKVPHFEKMLYDNAQLARAYLHAHLLTQDAAYRRVCGATLDFVLREMTHPQGGFFSSLDADSEGEEGKFYVWTPTEIATALEDDRDTHLILAAYGITESGNFEGANVLHRVLSDEQLAPEFNLTPEAVPAKLEALHAQLLAARSKRERPGTDDKILISWNALMMIAFAEAGRYLKEPTYIEAAIRNANFIIENMHTDGYLYRSWREGQASHNAYLEDYAALILGLLALYQGDPNPQWYHVAKQLTDELIAHFNDPEGGFFDTRADHETLILRPKDLQDNATPSGNALAALALLQLAALSTETAYRQHAEEMLQSMGKMLERYPTGFAQWLCAYDFAVAPVKEVAILGAEKSQGLQHLTEALWRGYRPYLMAAISHQYPPEAHSPGLLADRPLIDQQATAYVCQDFVCQTPVTSPQDFIQQLEAKT
jgi:uncharacterized protein YyaL (SSP411 family)